MLNIAADQMPVLQGLLDKLALRQSCWEDQAAEVTKAEAAVARLQARLAELKSRAEELKNIGVRPDQDRVKQLLEGADVPQIDKKEVEARNASARHIDAQRMQTERDLAALNEHLARLRSEAGRAAIAVGTAEAEFYDQVGEAVAECYQQAAQDFVSTFIPLFHSLNSRVYKQTGKNSVWFSRFVPNCLVVQWASRQMVETWTGGPKHPIMTVLWPRSDGALHSGEPVMQDDLVDDLVEMIRRHPPATETTTAETLPAPTAE